MTDRPNILLVMADQLAAAGRESVYRRQVIKEAPRRNDVHWDYAPCVDASRQYVR